jgi:hypothetical protein
VNNSYIIFFVSSKRFVMVSASVSAIAFCVSLFFVLPYTLVLPFFSAYLICPLLSIGLHLHMYMPTSLPVWQGGVGYRAAGRTGRTIQSRPELLNELFNSDSCLRCPPLVSDVSHHSASFRSPNSRVSTCPKPLILPENEPNS